MLCAVAPTLSRHSHWFTRARGARIARARNRKSRDTWNSRETITALPELTTLPTHTHTFYYNDGTNILIKHWLCAQNLSAKYKYIYIIMWYLK